MWNLKKGVREHGKIRFVHNIAHGPTVNVTLDGKDILVGAVYKAVSDYLEILEGDYTLAITAGGNVVAKIEITLNPHTDHTIIAIGDIKNLKTIRLKSYLDKAVCPHHDKSNVRFIHAAATAPAVDVWVTSANGEKMKAFKDIRYTEVCKHHCHGYQTVKAGTMTLSVTPAGSDTVVLGPAKLTLEPKMTYTLIATGLVGDKTAPLDVIEISDSYCSTVHMH